MSLFSKIGKALGSVVKPALGLVSKAASFIPGVGTVVSAATGIISNLLPDDKQQAIVNAVARDGEIKVDKIEETIASLNPGITPSTLMAGTTEMTKLATAIVPDASINDKEALTDIPFFDKVKSFFFKYKTYVFIVAGGAAAYWLFFKDTIGGRRRRRR